MSVVRLRHIAEINPPCSAFDQLNNDDELTFLPMEAVWPDSRLDVSRKRPKSEVLTGYTRFQDGDVLVPKITPTFEAGRSVLIRGLYNGVGAGTTELHVIRPGSSIHGRFLLYLVSTHQFLKFGQAEMYGVAGQKRVPDDFIRNLTVDLPMLEEQGRIADFLDAETAKYAALIAARHRQIELLRQRLESARDAIFAADGARRVPLMHLTDPYRPIVYGIVQAGPEIADGIPYIKTGDLPTLNVDSLSRTSPDIHYRYRRAMVRPGDIVIAMRASIGTIAMVPRELPEANLTQGTARIAPANHISGQWLFQVLQTRMVLDECDVRAVGSTFRTLNIWDLRRIPIPTLSRERQDLLSREFQSEIDWNLASRSRLTRQIDLLQERRQALITAAVTGQVDVTTARGAG